MNAREELAAVIIEHPWLASYQELYTGICPSCPGLKIHGGGNSPAHADHLADAILAAGYRKPRTITTREELDALPSGTAILDSDGNTNVLHDNGWVLPGSGGGYTSWAVAQALPVTVLYEPTP